MEFQNCFRDTCDRASNQLALFADQIGSTIPGATETAKAMLEKAAELQNMCAFRGRVHVIYEAVSNVVAPSTTSQHHSPATSPAALLRHQPLLCVLFSPTVILQGDNRIVPASQLVGALSSFSFIGSVTSSAHSTAAKDPTPPLQPKPNPPPIPPPKWYPGKRYDSGPQTEDGPLQVAEESFALFRGFSMNLTHKAYRAFFHRMYARIKDARNGNIPGPMSYERFSPPWIRRKMFVGTKIITFGDSMVPDLHRMRSAAGTRRLKVLLAAFHEREPLARDIIEEMIPAFHRERDEERARAEAATSAAIESTHVVQEKEVAPEFASSSQDLLVAPNPTSNTISNAQPVQPIHIQPAPVQPAHIQPAQPQRTLEIASQPSRSHPQSSTPLEHTRGRALAAGAAMVRINASSGAEPGANGRAVSIMVDTESSSGVISGRQTFLQDPASAEKVPASRKRPRATVGEPVLSVEPAATRRSRYGPRVRPSAPSESGDVGQESDRRTDCVPLSEEIENADGTGTDSGHGSAGDGGRNGSGDGGRYSTAPVTDMGAGNRPGILNGNRGVEAD